MSGRRDVMALRGPVGVRSRARLADEGGQMAVELAVLAPVALIVALVGLNLLRFVVACATFDRVSLDAVVAHGVAPAGEQSLLSAQAEVHDAIASSLGRDGCDVEVSVESLGDEGPMLVPRLTRFTCTLVFHPWPRTLRLPGVSYEAPLALRHQRALVVDRYRAGVVF